jgi:hypothetical protein
VFRQRLRAVAADIANVRHGWRSTSAPSNSRKLANASAPVTSPELPDETGTPIMNNRARPPLPSER